MSCRGDHVSGAAGDFFAADDEFGAFDGHGAGFGGEESGGEPVDLRGGGLQGGLLFVKSGEAAVQDGPQRDGRRDGSARGEESEVGEAFDVAADVGYGAVELGGESFGSRGPAVAQ